MICLTVFLQDLGVCSMSSFNIIQTAALGLALSTLVDIICCLWEIAREGSLQKTNLFKRRIEILSQASNDVDILYHTNNKWCDYARGSSNSFLW